MNTKKTLPTTPLAVVVVVHGFQFEIQGTVQGVFFRKYTQRQANHLGVLGWIRNDTQCQDRVNGEVYLRIEFSKKEKDSTSQSIDSFETISDWQHQTEMERQAHDKLQEMKSWLTCVGSPKSILRHTSFVPFSYDSTIQDDHGKKEKEWKDMYPMNTTFEIVR